MSVDIYVIPVDYTTEPVRVVTHEADDGPTVLRREIGAQWLDHAEFRTPWGPLQLWVDGESLLANRTDHNVRAIALCRDCAYDIPDVRGIAAIAAYDPATGDSVNPPPILLDYLQGWAPGDGELARASGMLRDTPAHLEAFIRQLLHDRIAPLFDDDTDWLSALNTKDSREIQEVLRYEADPMDAAAIWVNSKFGVAGSPSDDGKPEISPQAKSLLDHVQDQVHDLLCNPTTYQEERSQIVKVGQDSQTAIVTVIAASVSPFLGGASTLILPAVALIATMISRIGLNAWCAMQTERRRLRPDDS